MLRFVSLVALIISAMMISTAAASKNINVAILYAQPIPDIYTKDIARSRDNIQKQLKKLSADLVVRRGLRSEADQPRVLQSSSCSFCGTRPPGMCTFFSGGIQRPCRRALDEADNDPTDIDLFESSSVTRHLGNVKKVCASAIATTKENLFAELGNNGTDWINANGMFECIEMDD